MSLQFKQLLSHLSSDDILLINSFIEKRLISEKQFIRSLIKSFGISNKSETVKIKTEIGKLLMVLMFIRDSNLKKVDPKKHSELIKRLMSDNGQETVNEIICHIGLSQFFTTYQITSLFENQPDGYIVEDSSQIPIEIKSRFPKLFERLGDFYQKLSELWRPLRSQNLVVQVRILNLDKKINSECLNEEIDFIKSNYEQIDVSKIPTFPANLILERTTEFIEYTVIIFSMVSSNNNSVRMSPQEMSNCIYMIKLVQVLEKGVSGCYSFSVTLEDKVRQLFSKILITECINNMKNIPSEPRGIAIYSPMLNDPYLTDFFNTVISNYILANKGTMIIGISGSFNERKENGIGLASIKVGSDIQDRIKKLFIKPEALI